MNGVSYLADMLQQIADRGRRFLAAPFAGEDAPAGLEAVAASCRALLSSRGEASGMALARSVLAAFEGFGAADKRAFLKLLAEDFGADGERIARAIAAWQADPTPTALQALHLAAEPSRQELIRRLNLAPGGTAALVAMRERLLAEKKGDVHLEALDADFAHLFASWFNRGFLVLRPISWSTPADILEKIIRYEAVHTITGWDDLRRRLVPEDRRCFAFFHPRLSDDPLIFVEVALTREIPASIDAVLGEDRVHIAAGEATTAVFYSISNCQEGLRGISFGNFLIKQVVEDLSRELPRLDTFVTLSPVPGFSAWLARERADETSELIAPEDRERLALLDTPGWADDAERAEAVRPALLAAAAAYFLKARNGAGKPPDPVARFHLGNGARLERLNHLGDRSARAMASSHGLMVNYLYKLDDIEANHEAYAAGSDVPASAAVRKLVRTTDRGRERRREGAEAERRALPAPAAGEAGGARGREERVS